MFILTICEQREECLLCTEYIQPQTDAWYDDYSNAWLHADCWETLLERATVTVDEPALGTNAAQSSEGSFAAGS